jgi:hypothetical protein
VRATIDEATSAREIPGDQGLFDGALAIFEKAREKPS